MDITIICLLLAFSIAAPTYMYWRRDLKTNQKRVDLDRNVFEVIYPDNLKENRPIAFLHAIGNLMRESRRGSGTPTVVFETLSSEGSLTHRIRVPARDADYLMGQLDTHLHGIDVTPTEELLSKTIQPDDPDGKQTAKAFTYGVRVTMSDPERLLRIANTDDHSAKILRALQNDDPNVRVVMQWSLATSDAPKLADGSPPRPSMLKSLIYGASTEQPRYATRDEQTFVVAGYVAAAADDEQTAQQLVEKVVQALQSENSSNGFLTQPIPTDQLNQTIELALMPTGRWGNLFSVSEAAAVLGFPIGDPKITGLTQGSGRRFAAPEAISRTGRVFGDSDIAGPKRPIAVPYSQTSRHQLVVGGTGTGKSVFLSNNVIQDISNGNGVIVLDAAPDISPERLFSRVLASLPTKRLDDVIVVAPGLESETAVSINVLDQGLGKGAIDHVATVFESDKDLVSIPELLHHGLWTLIEPGGYTLLDLAYLLSPRNEVEMQWARNLIEGVQDPDLRDFWARYPGATLPLDDMSKAKTQWKEYVTPLQRRLWKFASRHEVRQIIGQTKSTINFRDVLMGNKILLITLGNIPQSEAKLLANLITGLIWDAAQAVLPERDNYLYLDEFQLSAGSIRGGLDDLLARARGRKLGLALGTQFLTLRERIPPSLVDAALNNTDTQVVFTAKGATEAALWSRQFGSTTVKESDITKLRKYHGIAQIGNDQGVRSPVSFKALRELAKTENELTAMRRSAAKYAMPVDQIRREIDLRRRPAAAPRPASPRVIQTGPTPWNPDQKVKDKNDG